MIWTLTKSNKKMESPRLFTRQQALKLGHFYWLHVKNSNPLRTEWSLCYLKHTKFYLEHKASFIQISSIASFKSFLIPWLWGYCTFSDSSVVSFEVLALTQIHQIRNYFPPKNHVLPSNFFSSSNLFFIRVFLANTWGKNRGSPCLFPHKLLWKVEMVWDRSRDG